MRSLVRGAVVVALIVSGSILAVPSPAAACDCGPSTVVEDVTSASAVYIARSRLPDVVPGRSFRIVRTLEGPVRTGMRVAVTGGQAASCGTRILDTDYVLTVRAGGEGGSLNLCNEHLRGPAAVAEAQQVLGSGEPVPWRPDPVGVAQWIAFALLAGALLLLRRRRGRP